MDIFQAYYVWEISGPTFSCGKDIDSTKQSAPTDA